MAKKTLPRQPIERTRLVTDLDDVTTMMDTNNMACWLARAWPAMPPSARHDLYQTIMDWAGERAWDDRSARQSERVERLLLRLNDFPEEMQDRIIDSIEARADARRNGNKRQPAMEAGTALRLTPPPTTTPGPNVPA